MWTYPSVSDSSWNAEAEMGAFVLFPQLTVTVRAPVVGQLSLAQGVRDFSFLQGPLGKARQTPRKPDLILRSSGDRKWGAERPQANLKRTMLGRGVAQW